MELKTIKSKQRAYKRRWWLLFLVFGIGLPALGILLLSWLREAYHIRQIDYIFYSLLSPALIFGLLLSDRTGRAELQKIMLYNSELVYTFYRYDENTNVDTIHIKQIRKYTITKRYIRIKCDFFSIKLIRIFENEDMLIRFLNSHIETSFGGRPGIMRI